MAREAEQEARGAAGGGPGEATLAEMVGRGGRVGGERARVAEPILVARPGHPDAEVLQDALGGLDRADQVRGRQEAHARGDGGFEVAHEALRVGERDPGAEVVQADVVTLGDGVKRLTRVGEVGEDFGGLRWREGEHVRLRGREREWSTPSAPLRGAPPPPGAGEGGGGEGEARLHEGVRGRGCARAGVRRERGRQRFGTAAAGAEGEFENPVWGRRGRVAARAQLGRCWGGWTRGDCA